LHSLAKTIPVAEGFSCLCPPEAEVFAFKEFREMMKLSAREFDRAVQRSVKRIPREIRKHLDNIIISVQKWPSKELLEEMGLPPDEPLLGVYTGASLMERSHFDTLQYPDTIQIFQEPLEEMCETMEELEEEIEITVVHEVAHFIGMTEQELADLGYE